MNKKNVVIVLLSLMVIVFTMFFLFGYKIELLIQDWRYRHERTYSSEETADELATAVEYYGHPEVGAADAVYSCDGLYFYGDTGYLTRGDLLDQSAVSAYKSLPDTIYRIAYGTELQHMNEKNVKYYNKKARFAPIKQAGDNQVVTTYLTLAQQGKVEYLVLLPNSQNSLELEDECDFRNKYGEYFDPDVKWQRDIPLAIKEVLADYFRSEEGSKYRFVDDRRALKHLACPGTFTGMNQYTNLPNKEIALILTENNADGNNRERILVIGYDDVNYRGYILYNEVFYNTKLLITTYKNSNQLPEEASSLAKYVDPEHQIIQVKTDDDARFYLYYEKEFDTMSRRHFGNDDEEDDCGGC